MVVSVGGWVGVYMGGACWFAVVARKAVTGRAGQRAGGNCVRRAVWLGLHEGEQSNMRSSSGHAVRVKPGTFLTPMVDLHRAIHAAHVLVGGNTGRVA